MQNIENIIFDLGGVLLDIDYNRTRDEFEKLGVTRFNEMYSQANADRLFQKLETGTIDEEDFYKELNHSSGMNLSPDEIKKAWNAMLLTFREDSLQFLDQLKNKYRIFLLSNTNKIHFASFDEIYYQTKRSKKFEEFFDKIFYSFEIGLRKPDATCYKWVLKDLNLNPERTLFIDDSIDNINGANSVGIQTLLLSPGKRIENLGL
ncbi:MAG: HAD family phosphatase [Ginsengibacter sp.]